MTTLSSHTWLMSADSLLFMAKTLSDVLAANLTRLQEEQKDELGSQPKIAAKTARIGKRIGQRTVGRALKGEVSTTIGSLEALAAAFGVEPWQLLVPPPEPEAKPTAEDIRKVEEVKGVFASLTPAQRELFVHTEEGKSLVPHYPVEKMDARKWSAAAKRPSRRAT